MKLLSPMEHKILTLMARGFIDKEIGVQLGISVRTVQAHISSIIIKLRARNRVNAVVVYMHKNLACDVANPIFLNPFDL